MPATFPNPANGAVALPDAIKSDFVSFEIEESQNTESVAAYGTGTYDPYRGSATPHQTIQVAGFAKYGASTAYKPGFGLMSAAGGTGTFTVDTAVTLSGTYVMRQVRLAHSRVRAAVAMTYQLDNGGDITTTWPS